MPTKARTGDTIKTYQIEKLLNAGAMALAYKAKRGSESVFFKQYKSPTPSVPWYRKYIEYQQELKRRIESTAAKNFSYRFVEFFDHDFKGGPNFFQVFEWVEGGRDLEHLLAESRSSSAMPWSQRLTLAKVMMAGINAIHEARIIHCDLKPPNIYLFHDPDIEAGYRLKVIDMDFSILSDIPAPWHGSDTGYVGTPRYFSPEHLKGQVPCQASDLFTCGIILYELLTGEHPYGDESTYAESVSGWKAPSPKLLGQIGDSSDLTEKARQLLHLCLHPDVKLRPTAKDINLALRGRFTGTVVYPPASGPKPAADPSPAVPAGPAAGSGTPAAPPVTPPPPPPSPAERRFQPLELAAEGGKVFMCGIRTDVGRHICLSLGEDAKYMHDTKQFSLVPDEATGGWMLEPNTAAKNQTVVNEKAVTTSVKLANGDVIGVGNEAKKIIKLPLIVRLGEGAGSRKLDIPAFDGWSDDPVRAAGLLQQAEKFLSCGQPDRAGECIQQAISADWNGSNPSTRPYYVMRAAVRAAQGSPAEQQALEKYSDAHKAARRGAYPESRQLYLEAIQIDGSFLWSANNVAWLEATCRDEAGRNGSEAVKYALLACEASKWHCWAFIDTLAAACAECGDFANAIMCVERAIQLAPPAEQATLQASMAGYRQKRPLRVASTPG